MCEKYQVIKSNCDLSTEIIATLYTYSEAVEHLNLYIKNNFELSEFLKIYHDNENTMSMFQYHYIFPKKLIAKFHIVKYLDIELS